MNQQCDGALIIKGAFYMCDEERGHLGWPHGNAEVGAVWNEDRAKAVADLEAIAASLLTSGDIAGWGHLTEAARIVRGDA